MNLLDYNNKKVKILDVYNELWIGMAYYCDKDTNETDEDVLVVNDGTIYMELLESEIKFINVINR